MLSKRFIKFCLVGVVNTLLDIGLFLVLRGAGVNLVVANIISTSVAIMVSLILNYNYTFKETEKLTKTKLFLYVAITLTGLWILQPIIIFSVTSLNNLVNYIDLTSGLFGHRETLVNLIPKLFATAFTVVWNYYLYKRFVFNSKEDIKV